MLFDKSPPPCIGYLDHPFKNKPFETEKDLLPCLQTQEGWCTISSRRQHPHARTTILFHDGEPSSMTGGMTSLQQLKEGCLHALSSRLTRWTKALTSSLPLSTLADLSQSQSELGAANALLRQPLLILRRQVKRPACTKPDRMLLVLLARLVRTWQQTHITRATRHEAREGRVSSSAWSGSASHKPLLTSRREPETPSP